MNTASLIARALYIFLAAFQMIVRIPMAVAGDELWRIPDMATIAVVSLNCLLLLVMLDRARSAA